MKQQKEECCHLHETPGPVHPKGAASSLSRRQPAMSQTPADDHFYATEQKHDENHVAQKFTTI
jgi:hypothetical protein